MSKFETSERSGAQELSEEQLKEIKKPAEGGNIEEEKYKFKAEDKVFEQRDENAPVIPSNPQKMEDWPKLQQEQQMELWNKYLEQKKAREEWEKFQEASLKENEAA